MFSPAASLARPRLPAQAPGQGPEPEPVQRARGRGAEGGAAELRAQERGDALAPCRVRATPRDRPHFVWTIDAAGQCCRGFGLHLARAPCFCQGGAWLQRYTLLVMSRPCVALPRWGFNDLGAHPSGDHRSKVATRRPSLRIGGRLGGMGRCQAAQEALSQRAVPMRRPPRHSR